MKISIPAYLRRQVREAFQHRCAYCLTPEELTVTTFEIDHIIPVQAGGARVRKAVPGLSGLQSPQGSAKPGC